MVDEETIRQQAQQALEHINLEDTDSEQVVRDIKTELWRFRQPRSKALFLDEAVHFVQAGYNDHLAICKLGDACLLNKSLKSTLFVLQQEVDALATVTELPPQKAAQEYGSSSELTHLHPTIQLAAATLYATGHYRQALLDAFIAVDSAVKKKSQLGHTGTRLMEVAFSPGNPVIKIGDGHDEQQGFLALFRGAMLAIRNPKAHSLDGAHDAQRTLEWLSFASVLLRNLDDAVVQPPTV